MATAPVKSQPLHYFSLPHLKWGQKSQTNTNHRFRRRDPSPQTSHLDGGSELPQENQHDKQQQEQEQEEEVKLWNLRPRKAEKNVEMGVESNNNNNNNSNHVVISQRLQKLKDNNENGNGHGVGSGKKKKLWISLSREEIEEDVYSMTGSRPSRRPKKRSKTIQKQLDCVFPGLYLVGLTADSYRVNDTAK